ncbi:MAG: 4Fe-4S dicluster domain-containing protein, partial [Halofilum sp. (in: g-proteobacteria)]
QPIPLQTGLDWSEHGGFAGAVEMCNNNGHCRKFDAAVMCPSYRATGDEQHLTRGRANSLRLALSGQLGRDALTSAAMHDTMALCVGCKGCKRECPTGVDMAKMKVEFLHHYHQRHGYRLRERLIAHLPRYAPWASRMGPLLHLRDRVPGFPSLSERLLGLSARRRLPRWHPRPFRERGPLGEARTGEAVLFADTFNRWHEPDNLRAAVEVLNAAGYRLHLPEAAQSGRPLCCGRTYLAVGDVTRARAEAQRTVRALLPMVERGLPIVGLEPSCMLTLRDELRTLLPGTEAENVASATWLTGEFLAAERRAGRAPLELLAAEGQKILVHGHCHQKAFDALAPALETLAWIPGAQVEAIDATCCGMAGAFGYEREHFDASLDIGELGVLPAVRSASAEACLVADGTSCRQQIRDGAGRDATHSIRVLQGQLRFGGRCE